MPSGGETSMKIYIDGKYYDKEDAKVSVFDHGVLADGSDEMKRVIGYQTLMSAGFTSIRRAVLRVVQDGSGKIVLVELVEPSQLKP